MLKLGEAKRLYLVPVTRSTNISASKDVGTQYSAVRMYTRLVKLKVKAFLLWAQSLTRMLIFYHIKIILKFGLVIPKTNRGHVLTNVPWRAMVNSHCVDKAFKGNDFTP